VQLTFFFCNRVAFPDNQNIPWQGRWDSLVSPFSLNVIAEFLYPDIELSNVA